MYLGGGLQYDGGGGEPAGRTLRRELDRVARGFAELQAVGGDREPSGTTQVAAGEPGREGRLRLVHAFGDEGVHDERLGQRGERDDVAPREHGVGQLVRACRHQQEHGVGGRLLQHLQQRVGGGWREPVGLTVHEDLAARFGRGARGWMPHLVADRVDVDVAALRFDQELVGMVVLQRQAAIAALATAAGAAHQGGHERACGDRLAASLRSGEHVGVVRPLGGAGEERHGDVLAWNAREDGLHPAMVARRCDCPARCRDD